MGTTTTRTQEQEPICDILGTILRPLVTLSGSSPQNNVFTYSSSDTTPGLIDTGCRQRHGKCQGIGASTTVSGGSGNDTINVGSLSPARGGVLEPDGRTSHREWRLRDQ